jgi:hypothetical protein
MKWKLASAFATGALLASGIVYLAVRPTVVVPDVAPEVVQVPALLPDAPKPAPIAQVKVAQPKLPPTPVPTVRKPVSVPPAPVREKPSPFRPLMRHEEVAVVTPQPAPEPERPSPAPPPAAPPPPAPAKVIPTQNVSLPARVAHTVTLAAGTLLPVRIGESLSSTSNQPGDTFLATLTQPLVVGEWVIADPGAHVRGRVIEKDAAHLRISIVWFATLDGQSIPVHTEPYIKLAPAAIPVDARIIFKVQDSVTITERVD